MGDAFSEFSPAIRQFSTETLIRRTRASIGSQAISPVALDAVIIRPGVKTMVQREVIHILILLKILKILFAYSISMYLPWYQYSYIFQGGS